jgi:hypothetical protein
MRHIKRWSELFESEGKLTKEQTEFLDRYTNGKWTLNSSTGLVDVNGDFICFRKGLYNLSGIKFGSVTRDFNCSENKLTSPVGAPKEVGGDFNCSENELTTLVGAPKKVFGDFDCSFNNNLTSLEGAPKEVVGGFYCSSNNLTTLEGAPERVGRDFYCTNNDLTSLKGAPLEVGGYFHLGKVIYLGMGENLIWTTEGKLKFIKSNSHYAKLVIPTLPYKDLLKIVSEDPSLLGTIEEADKSLCDKVIKGLGWDKMGPDLLRQLKYGIF